MDFLLRKNSYHFILHIIHTSYYTDFSRRFMDSVHAIGCRLIDCNEALVSHCVVRIVTESKFWFLDPQSSALVITIEED
jgi:hypothetical protein